MKRLFFLAAVAMVAISITGCGRNRRMWCYQNPPCAPACQPPCPCGDATTTYDDGVIIQGDPASLPPSLPGPVSSS